MQIKVIASGEPHSIPFIKNFEFKDQNDEVYIASLKRIKENLQQNLLLNINDVLLLFTGFVVDSVKKKNTTKEINDNTRKILSYKQVMIGVPEMLQKLKFEVLLDNEFSQISIEQPIEVPAYTQLTN